jgi:hypothetical protein
MVQRGASESDVFRVAAGSNGFYTLQGHYFWLYLLGLGAGHWTFKCVRQGGRANGPSRVDIHSKYMYCRGQE